jgi:hypothetical protein
MHILLHVLGICNDTSTHPNLLGITTWLHENIECINLQTIKYLITKHK